ncbi:hypothetical protein MXD81_18405, partial [Microbacteriaceae bacterium K1510]|nr:hypothetical protein [Microbacteriaceae bacterium K1510]
IDDHLSHNGVPVMNGLAIPDALRLPSNWVRARASSLAQSYQSSCRRDRKFDSSVGCKFVFGRKVAIAVEMSELGAAPGGGSE